MSHVGEKDGGNSSLEVLDNCSSDRDRAGAEKNSEGDRANMIGIHPGSLYVGTICIPGIVSEDGCRRRVFKGDAKSRKHSRR